MPIATPEVYAEMLGRAKEHSFAFPAINCVGSESLNAALKGFADAGSDGIIQFSTGGAEFASGLGVKDMVTGAVALAEFAHIVADKYPITVALHTDHCPKDKLDSYVKPLLAISQKRVAEGKNPLFQSHMWDGSAVPIDENLDIARELLKEAAAARSSSRSRSGWSAARKTASRPRSTTSSTRPPRISSRPSRRWARASTASTCWLRRSAICTASTSRATSSYGRKSWPRDRRWRQPSSD